MTLLFTCRSAEVNYIRLSQVAKLQRAMVGKHSQYGDPSYNAGVMGSEHSTLDRTALCKLLVGEIELRERGRLWTAPSPTFYNTVYALNIYEVLVQLMLSAYAAVE
jgi:hypothetical protein